MKSIYLTLLLVSANLFSLAQCPVSTITVIEPTCNGLCDGTLIINTIDGVGPYQVFHPGSGIPMPYTSMTIITGLCSGSYTITVMDVMGCIEMQTVNIFEPLPVFVMTASTPESVPGACDGTISAIANGGTPGYTYNVTPPLPGVPPYTNVCAGVYDVSATDLYGCMNQQIVVVGNSCAVATITDATTPASCYGTCDGSATITASGGAAPYTVSGSFAGSPITFTTSTTLNGLCAGTTALTIEDDNGCTDNHAVVITQPTEIVIAMSSTDASAGNCDGIVTANITGGTAAYLITWYECVTNDPLGIVNQFLTDACPGDYYLVVTDMNGCSETSTCVTVDEQICDVTSSILNQTDSHCNGDCNGILLIQTTGGQPPYLADLGSGAAFTYSTVGMAGGLCAATYDIITTDVNGCDDTVTVTISEPPILAAVATETDASAPGICDGILSGAYGGGVAPYLIEWVNCSTGSIIGSGLTITNVCAGDYQLIITDANGCTDSSDCMNVADSITNAGFEQNTSVFKIYPNPVSDQLTIETSAENFYFEILNILGEVVHVSNPIVSNKTSFSLSNLGLSEGLYVVRLYAGETSSVMPLIILAQ